MQTEALLSTSLLRRACVLGILLSVAIFATNAQALDEPKVEITYSLKTADGGGYWQDISGTPFDLGNVNYVLDTADSQSTGPGTVNVLGADPLFVIMEFSADPAGNIIDGPVELTDTHFVRNFILTTGGPTVVTTDLDSRLSRTATGTLSGSTITWDNDLGVNTWLEDVLGWSTCGGVGCGFVVNPFPRDHDGTNEIAPLPTFSVFTNTDFADAFASDNGTVGVYTDDIPRADLDATVFDTWQGVETSRTFSPIPVPAISEIYLLVGTLGVVGLGCLRKRNGASA